ncbi:hypothetical protein HNP86_002025 [Methanococcus maripaludis]|uniref:Uncharacterized protein n=1 Tax=Methanococcus maripaludis TaxID=39152 RepID=A0A7J9P1E9_METMI|nr:hypothetical protein [Methanococcus maripaludis]MBA2851866.1 hypothetical protein [Methanococcus maripaludis]
MKAETQDLITTYDENGYPVFKGLTDEETEFINKFKTISLGREGLLTKSILKKSDIVQGLYDKGIIVDLPDNGSGMATIGLYGVVYPETMGDIMVMRSRESPDKYDLDSNDMDRISSSLVGLNDMIDVPISLYGFKTSRPKTNKIKFNVAERVFGLDEIQFNDNFDIEIPEGSKYVNIMFATMSKVPGCVTYFEFIGENGVTITGRKTKRFDEQC